MLSLKAIFSSGVKFAGRIGKEKGPEILMAVGTISFGMTVVSIAKKAPTAEYNRAFYRDECKANNLDRQERIEKYCREIVRPYLPAIGWGTVTLAAFYGSHILEKRKTAAAIAALGVLDKSFAAYREEHPVAMRHKEDEYIPIEETPIPKNVTPSSSGDTLFYDKVGGHWFYSTEGRIREGEARTNQELIGGVNTPLNTLWGFWGVDDDGYAGEALGFDDRCPVDVIFRPTMTSDHKPAIALIYSTTVIDRNALKR